MKNIASYKKIIFCNLNLSVLKEWWNLHDIFMYKAMNICL